MTRSSKALTRRLLIGASLLLLCFGAHARTLTLMQTWSSDFPIFSDTTHRFAERVRALSNGRLSVTIVGAETHGQPYGVFDAVRTGEYDLGHSASYYWKDIDPSLLFFSTMPFGMLPVEQYSWFYFGDGQTLMDEAYRPYNLLSFPGGNTGSQMGGWFQRRIRSLDSMQGLRMRIPGFAGEIMQDLGVETVNVAAGDMYRALKEDDIQAAEWVGPSLDFELDLHLVAPFYYTGWHEPATELQFLVNADVMASLPADLQAILRLAMRVSAYDMYIQSMHVSAEKWTEMRLKFPVIRVKDFPAPVLDALQASNQRKLAEFARLDPLAKRIIASQRDYLRETREWTFLSDYRYLESIGR